jgi:low temperature requirement protein LtrA
MKLAVSRAHGAEREVSPPELFFDLVYVFAIGQLSHHRSSTSICGRAPRR